MDNASTEELLKEINDEKAIAMIPVMVCLCILMIMGVLGNSMVCFYYGYKTRRTTNTIFICTVAIYDFLSCSVSIPIELVDLRFFYVFTDTGACKFLRFFNHFAAIGSAFTLLVIAVDRYRRICQPFKKQFTMRDAKIACVVLVFASILVSWPAFVFYSPVPVNLKSKQGTDVTGSDCTTIRNDDYKPFVWLYNGIHLLGFITIAAVLGIMYTLVGRVLLKHKLTRQQVSKTQPSSENANSQESAQTTISDQMDGQVNSDQERDNFSGMDNLTEDSIKANKIKLVNMNPSASVADINSARKQQPDQFDIKTVKLTIIMLVITIVFVVSFLPYLVLVIWRAFIGGHEENVLSDNGLVAFQFGLRSYFINSAVNPLTYGFFNSKFRHFFYKLFCPWCNKKAEKSVSFSSATA